MHRRRGTAYELLKLLEEGGEIGFWWLDLESSSITGSLGFLQITGLTAEADGRSLFGDLIHPADRTAHADMVDVMQRGHPIARTFRIIRPDRTVRWVAIRARTVLGAHDLPVRAEGVVLDVTMQQQALLLAAENQARYATVTRSIAALEWTASSSGQHRYPARWHELTGQSASDAQGEGWQQILHPEDRTRVAAAWQAAWTHLTPYDTDFRILCVDGRHRWYNSRAVPMLNGDGSAKEWLGLLLAIAGSPRFVPQQTDQVRTVLTPMLARGARGLLAWSVVTLAEAAQVSVSSIKRFEAQGQVRRTTRLAIQSAFERHGLRFVVDGDGAHGIFAAGTEAAQYARTGTSDTPERD